MRQNRLLGVCLLLICLVVSMPVTFAATLSLTYDANGNLVTGDGKYREYDGSNHLVRIRDGNNATGIVLENYTWHPVEERTVIKDVYLANGSWKETVYYPTKEFVRVENTSGLYDYNYVYQNGQLVAQHFIGEKKNFMLNDHKGTVTVVTNESGAKVEETFYSPFGEIISGGATSRFDYEGKEFDSVVGDYDFHARKVNPGWGIFTQPDTMLPNVYDPQQLNRYSFERNNPYKYTDEDGNEAIETTSGVVEKINTYLGMIIFIKERREQARERLYSELLSGYYQENPSERPSEHNMIKCAYCLKEPPTIEELERKKLKEELGVILKENGKVKAYTFGGEDLYTINYFLEAGYSSSAVEAVRELKRQEAISSLTYSQWLKTKEGKTAYKQMKEEVSKRVEEKRKKRQEEKERKQQNT